MYKTQGHWDKMPLIDAAECDEDDCATVYEGWICTRNAGHEMPHAAHGTRSNDSPVAVWDEASPPPLGHSCPSCHHGEV